MQSFGQEIDIQKFPAYDVTALFFTEGTNTSVNKKSRQELSKIIHNDFKNIDSNAGFFKVCSILPKGLSSSATNQCDTDQSLEKNIKQQTYLIYTQEDDRSAILKNIGEITEKRNHFFKFKFAKLSELYSEHTKGNVSTHVETLTMQIPDPYGVLSMFETGSGENFSKYSNEKFDVLLSKAKTEYDFNIRRELYNLAEKILLEDAIVIPLIHQSRVSILSKNLSGYNSSSIGPFYATYHKISKSGSQ